ncbi:MAG: hypothetical protein IKF52_00180 [Clostridia bacterium]|nr:hypothetical protein [Clostridia bacterium]
MKKESGITLVALVITIIVLLILAGVTIAMVVGDNGILTRANEAKDITKEAEIFEEIQLETAGAYGIDGYDLTLLQSNLEKKGKGYLFETMENGEVLKVTKDDVAFLVSKSTGEVTQISGKSVSNNSMINTKLSDISQDDLIGKYLYIADSNEKNWIILYKNNNTVVAASTIADNVECEIGMNKIWFDQEDADAFLETDLSECATIVRAFNDSDADKIYNATSNSTVSPTDLLKSNSKYILADCHIDGPDNDGVYYINADGSRGSFTAVTWRAEDNYQYIYYSDYFGIRPVFEFKSNAYITSGDGSSSNPYVLDI